MKGTRLGKWLLDEPLGSALWGEVYQARSVLSGQQRAWVQVLPVPSGMTEPALTAELLPLFRLDHAHLARYLDGGVQDGRCWVATEWLEGEDYAARVRRLGAVPWPEVLAVAVQVLRGLKHAHNRNILHRTLQPAHIFRLPDGTVKLLYCGLAKLVPPNADATVQLLRYDSYLPPELANGKPYTRRGEFYALGGVLYTLLTGRPPFAASNPVELLHKHNYVLPERPGLIVSNLPPEVDEWLCRLLEKNPPRRPNNAVVLLGELEHLRARLERQGLALSWPPLLTPDTVESPALPAATASGSEAATDKPSVLPRPLLQRPWVVIPAFLLVVALLAYAFLRPRPSADELFAAARPLMNSPSPDDWQRAWEEYLEPLARRYPGQYEEEIAQWRRRWQAYNELKRVFRDGPPAASVEAERWFWRGLRLAQCGDYAEARRIWQSLTVAFADIDSARPWVDLARVGLATLETVRNTPPPGNNGPPPDLEQAILRVKALREAGRIEEAATVRKALEDLYKYLPSVLPLPPDPNTP